MGALRVGAADRGLTRSQESKESHLVYLLS